MTSAERSNALILGGGVLLLFAGLSYFGSSSSTSAPKPKPAPTPTPTPTPTPIPGKTYPVVVMGSSWVMRAAWVRDHGNFGPLYKPDGTVSWIAFGTRLQTTGPPGTFNYAVWISPTGQTCCPGAGYGYPVAGGYVGMSDVVPG